MPAQMKDAMADVESQFMRGRYTEAPGLFADALEGDDQLASTLAVIKTQNVGWAFNVMKARVERSDLFVIHEYDAQVVVSRGSGEFEGPYGQRFEQTRVNSESRKLAGLEVANFDGHAAGGLPFPLAAASWRRRSRSSLNFA